MNSKLEHFVNHLSSLAEEKLAKLILGVTYVLQEQCGIKIAKDNNLNLSEEVKAKMTSLFGVAELILQLRESLLDQARKGEITDFSRYTPEKKAIKNQEEFIRTLLGKRSRLIDKLAMVSARAKLLFDVLQNCVHDSASSELEVKVLAWKSIIDRIGLGLCEGDKEKDYYQKLVETNVAKLSNRAKQKIKKLVQSPKILKAISNRLDTKQVQTLADILINEYIETAFTLNVARVLNRMQNPLGFVGKFRKLFSILEGYEFDSSYAKVIESNNLAQEFDNLKDEIIKVDKLPLNDEEKKERILKLQNSFKDKCSFVISNSGFENPDKDEAIDIVSLRKKFSELQDQARKISNLDFDRVEERLKLVKLDEQVQSLLIFIGNKLDRIFPNLGNLVTNLTEVLEKEEAVCAGKVSVLLAISKYLGIRARASCVKEMLDNNTKGHVCCEFDLPSGRKLVMDTSFENILGLESQTDEQLIDGLRKRNPLVSNLEIQTFLKYKKMAFVNARFIPVSSKFLTYITENTRQGVENDKQLRQVKDIPNLFIRINPYTEQKEIWKASIPYPHLVMAPDKDGNVCINSSFASNTGQFITKNYVDIGMYLLKKNIDINPCDGKAYVGLAKILPGNQKMRFLEEIRSKKTSLYWEEISIDHAMFCIYYFDDLDAALKIFEETKHKNPQAYYSRIYELTFNYISKAKRAKGKSKKKLIDKARLFMQKARSENPELFYDQKLNVLQIASLYDGQIDEQIKIYEEFKTWQESKFWDDSDYLPPFHKLMQLYLEWVRSGYITRDKLVTFASEIKSKAGKFYAKEVGFYAQEIYLRDGIWDYDQAAIMLEEARKNLPAAFFQNYDNIRTLAMVYERQQRCEDAISLYEELKAFNPDLFWNYKYFPVYEDLTALYVKANQVDKAIKIFEEAKKEIENY
ncbi:MAG: hypothetical protein N2558_02065 [Patescibacteria group bacterium]|nr:hypothetical protein [Patescibacteria group bacterium]